MTFRYAVRRTQKQVDAERKAKLDVASADRKALQAEAKRRGIPANQSTEALREQLA